MIIRTADETQKIKYLKDSNNDVYCLDSEGAPLKLQLHKEVLQSGSGEGDAVVRDFVKSPMSGTVVKVHCEVGQSVKKGQSLISVEAMKMEHLARATHDAKVKEIRVEKGTFVNEGDRVIIFE